MRYFTMSMIVAICILSLTGTCFAAPVTQAEGQQYFYSTEARDTYNFAHLHLYGNRIRIVRRGHQNPLAPDLIRIQRDDTVFLSRSQDWEASPVDGENYGYEAELDAGNLEDGEYVLSIESSALEWSRSETEKPTGVRSPYVLASVGFVKQGSECYIPPDNRLSSRYNNSLLLQLGQGDAPDDFTVLKEYYAKQENSRILKDIEAKSKELTAGLYSDPEKCLSISRWITTNIAYDFDFPRESIDQWLKMYPGESVRQEDALHAFESGYAMCYGYAKLATLMLGYAGIDSVYVKGYQKNDISNTWSSAEISSQYSSSWNTGVPSSWFFRAADGTEVPDVYNHAWNAVKLSGSWYFIDTCKDALYGYYRTNSLDPHTAYTKLNQCYSAVHVFPSLSQLSNTHIAIRYGAEGYGKKLKDTW